MGSLEVSVNIWEKIIAHFINDDDVALADALRAMPACKTFRDLIHQEVIHNVRKASFATTCREDRPVIAAYLRVHLELLLQHRANVNNDFQWLQEFLGSSLDDVLKQAGCDTHDALCSVYKQQLITYLGTTAKDWTIENLLQGDFYSIKKIHGLGPVCAAIVIGRLDAVQKYFENSHTRSRFLASSRHVSAFDIFNREYAFSQPLLVAIATGNIEILEYLHTGESWPESRWFGFSMPALFQVLRFAIGERQTQAAFLIHKSLIYQEDLSIKKYQAAFLKHKPLICSENLVIKDHDAHHHFLEQAALANDIVTFRVLVHLLALRYGQNYGGHADANVTFAKRCDNAHDDVVWFMLKYALELCEGIYGRLSLGQGEDCLRLISFIIVHYDMILKKSAVPHSKLLREAIDAGDLFQVKHLLAQGAYMHEEDMQAEERWLSNKGYKWRVFEKYRADATGLGRGKDTLVALCYAYRASERNYARKMTTLEQLAKHMEQKVKMKSSIREMKKTARECQKTTVDRDLLWLQKAEREAKKQPLVVLPEDGDEVGKPTTLACGALILSQN